MHSCRIASNTAIGYWTGNDFRTRQRAWHDYKIRFHDFPEMDSVQPKRVKKAIISVETFNTHSFSHHAQNQSHSLFFFFAENIAPSPSPFSPSPASKFGVIGLNNIF